MAGRTRARTEGTLMGGYPEAFGRSTAEWGRPLTPVV